MIHRPLSSRPVVESMEARILHSADLLGVASVVGDASQAVEQRIQPPSEAATAGATTTTARSEIAFVDAGVPDRERLLDELRRQAQAGRPIEVIEIGADDDGIALIGRELARRSDIGAVHLLSHGQEGTVRLGNALLDESTLLQRAGEIAGWSQALAAGADLLVYGCDVAAGSDGEALINDLAMLTGADVAASTDPTGAAARGGDWVLEATTGSIEAAVALDAAMQQQWDGLLATYAANPTEGRRHQRLAALGHQPGQGQHRRRHHHPLGRYLSADPRQHRRHRRGRQRQRRPRHQRRPDLHRRRHGHDDHRRVGAACGRHRPGVPHPRRHGEAAEPDDPGRQQREPGRRHPRRRDVERDADQRDGEEQQRDQRRGDLQRRDGDDADRRDADRQHRVGLRRRDLQRHRPHRDARHAERQQRRHRRRGVAQLGTASFTDAWFAGNTSKSPAARSTARAAARS